MAKSQERQRAALEYGYLQECCRVGADDAMTLLASGESWGELARDDQACANASSILGLEAFAALRVVAPDRTTRQLILMHGAEAYLAGFLAIVESSDDLVM